MGICWNCKRADALPLNVWCGPCLDERLSVVIEDAAASENYMAEQASELRS